MNPFKKNGLILPIASINSLYVDDTLAYDLFRPALILKEIVKYKEELGLTHIKDNSKLLFLFNNLLNSEIECIKEKASEIAVLYGDYLAEVLGTLFRPSRVSIQKRKDWTREHWNFWKTIDTIYLVGGLTSPILTQIFYERVKIHFKNKNITNKTITFIEGSSNLGTHGLSTLVETGDYLLFDFGQTTIKRARHYKVDGKIVIDTILPTISSDFLFYKSKNEAEVIEIANKLDEFIINNIMNTFRQVAFTGDRIYMSIANYIYEGNIYSSRGGYGKLAHIASNYEEYLSKRVSEKARKEIIIKIFHDTSAMALMFKNEKNTAVISLGTAFGIAFPE